MRNVNDLPDNLPIPTDDGKTRHLLGQEIPNIRLISTVGQIELWKTFQTPTVLFIYPKAGSPLEANTNQELWDSIPGARGCTPQSCGFRDLEQDFKTLGVEVYGLSIQSPSVQREFIQRNEISFPIISDELYLFTDKLNLPTFNFEGHRLIKRMALFIKEGKIQKVFYPVFPPDKNAEEVYEWLQSQIQNSEF